MSGRRGLPAESHSPSAAHTIVGNLPDDPVQADGDARAAPRPRAKFTTQIAAEVVEELRDAVVYLPTRGVRTTVASATEEALRRELARLRHEYHDGKPFPSRGPGQPPPGRPIYVKATP